MLQVKCKICNNVFCPRPSHAKRGWGVYCSLNCKNIGAQKRIQKQCSICGVKIFRIPSKIEHSKSGKFFCSKSCQTKWRNIEYSGNKHSGWKGGLSIYRNIIIKSTNISQCFRCGKNDKRILVVHHIDENHKNNNITNLMWLCHNCHYLAHHDMVERTRLLAKVRKN